MRKFVVADVRGEIRLLKQLIDRIGPTENDYVLFTGSYLGPGSDSKATLDYLIDLKQKHPGVFHFLIGCYEHIFQQVLAKEVDPSTRMLWESMGGVKVLQSYACTTDMRVLMGGNGKINHVSLDFVVPEAHIQFLEKNLHLWYMDHDLPFVVFHSAPDLVNFQNPGLTEVVFGVNDWWMSKWEISGTNIVFSHTPFSKPFRKNGKIGIDLGAGFGGKLCAYEASSDAFLVEG